MEEKEKEAKEKMEDPDEEVEYTDSLGRSRRVKRKDLALLKSRDEELRGEESVAAFIVFPVVSCFLNNYLFP